MRRSASIPIPDLLRSRFKEGTFIPVSTRKERSTFISIDRMTDSQRQSLRDRIAVEEPLEIRLNGKSVAVVMRSPGNDEELACGFLLTEGLLKGKAELESVGHRRDRRKPDHGNVVDVVSTDGSALAKRGWQRNFVSASSCGLCGKLTIESVRLQAPPVRGDDLKVSPAILYRLVDKMRAGQSGFEETGGIHAAGLFDPKGNLLKVWTLEKVEKIEGHWTPMAQKMANVQQKTESTLETKSVRYNAEVADSVFTKTHLQR